MKISKNTLALLKSMNNINPSIYISEGSVVRSISPQKTIVAFADVDETFEQAFGIYDLNQFLSVVSLFDNPEFDFKENSVVISQGTSSVEYFYADKEMITQAPEQRIKLPDVAVEFELKDEVRKSSLQAAAVLQVPNWMVVGDGKKIYVTVADAKNRGQNSFKTEVGTTKSKFKYVFKIENLKMISDAFKVEVSSKGIASFESVNNKVVYYVPTENV